MLVLANLTDKTTFESLEITAPTDGQLQIFVNGVVGLSGRVSVLRRDANGVFFDYPELTFFNRTAVEMSVATNDRFKVQFTGCISAGIEIRL